MENTSTYFSRRAQQQHAMAAKAVSAEARIAHLGLSFRLVNLATDLVVWSEGLKDLSPTRAYARRLVAVGPSEVGKVLVGAFPVQPNGTFCDLLEAIDEAERTPKN